MIKEAILN